MRDPICKGTRRHFNDSPTQPNMRGAVACFGEPIVTRALPGLLAGAVVVMLALPAAVLAQHAGSNGSASVVGNDGDAPDSGFLAGLLGLGPTRASPADGEGAHDGHAEADDAMHSHARERTTWPDAEGDRPASPKGLVEVRSVLIEGEPDFGKLKDSGITVTGEGTLDDPYVIEGLHVTRVLEIKDTADYYVIRENWIAGTLRLNWNADNVHVHHNHVNDLRVNENVERSGDATGGLIEENEFGIVGQIRHFDGVFRNNVVGPAPPGFFDPIIEDSGEIVPVFSPRRVLNIDGFDGAVFEGNDITGYVEMQLHGHHHASCFACHSHNHGDAKQAMKHDHSIRYHEAVFRDNAITVERGIAFRFTDTAHAGDDRTARSEPEESLRGPHVHYTDILIEGNTLTGGPLVVDVFNAEDRYHDGTVEDEAYAHAFRGEFVIRDNAIAYTLPDQAARANWLSDAPPDGILLKDVRDAEVIVEGNRVTLENAKDASALRAVPLMGEWMAPNAPAGLRLFRVEAASVDVVANSIRGPHFGVLAEHVAKDVTWTLSDNEYRDVEEDVGFGSGVESKPDKG